MSEAKAIRKLLESINICESLFTSNFTKKVQETESWKEGDYHQAVLDIAYDDWQRENSSINSFGSMIQHTMKEYGEFPALMVFLGKYNQQVTNGGHYQYLDNGYSSYSKRGLGSSDEPDIDLHVDMLELFKRLGLFNDLQLAPTVYDIMQEFVNEVKNFIYDSDEWQSAADNFENDRYSDYSSSEDEEYSEPEPNMFDYFNHLDDAYYKICDQWISLLNDYIKEKIQGIMGHTKMPVNRGIDSVDY